MNLDLTPADIAFREEVRAFIASAYVPTPTSLIARERMTREERMAWHKALHKKGWVAPGWPAEYGGPGWTPTQRYIFEEETARAETTPLLPFGLQMVGPVIYTFGNAEQKARFLPGILSGEDWWCQGYSEPGAGSDLANLRTRAVRDGDHYVVDGMKTWTTLAQFADWGFFLVRTDPEARKPQEGISFLLIDLKSPGVTVRPIIMLDGGHEVNEVYLDSVRVPVANRIGEENKGWTYAKFLLAHERTGIAGVARTEQVLARLRAFAATTPGDDGRMLAEDAGFQRKLAEFEIDMLALKMTELRVLASEQAGQGPGPESSILKIKGTELQQRVSELFLEAAGAYAAPYLRDFPQDGNERVSPPDAADAALLYFNWRKVSIYGGSNEIQRNIIAKQVLGL
ncbi:MAG: acyl-CoA dehydrogenase family protein [Hyphomonadaceae bacterium]|nr:acyl-CoA dehydrogenase family protein [Hyphomonadaceae bacterium]